MFKSLRTKRWAIILAGTLIVATPLLGLALFVYIDITSELKKLSSEKRQTLAFTTAHILDEKLRSEISFGKAYSARPELIAGIIHQDEEKMRQQLQNLLQTSSSIERALITSPAGILLADYPAVAAVRGKDFSGRDWYRGVSRSNRPYISEFYRRDAPPRQYLFAIALPVRSHDNTVVGILTLQPKVNFIKDAFDSIGTNGGSTYLIDKQGVTIFHTDSGEEKTVNPSDALIVKEVLQGHDGYEKGIDPVTGETMSSAFHPVDISGWGVVTERPIDEILAPADEITRSIYFFTAIMLLVGTWLSWRRSELLFTLKKTSAALQKANERLQNLNEALQAQQEELTESNRLLTEVSQIKSDFLANMSHELRTPLNSVIGFSELLHDKLYGAINEKQERFVTNIQRNGKHLLSLINDILDLSKVESGRMELDLSTFPLREGLNDSLAMLREKALKSEIDLQLQISPAADIRIEVDQRKLKQIMFNLLSNAIKFTAAGGSVEVSAQRDGDFIQINVADTGIGIKEEDFSRLFQAFVQLEPAYTKGYEGTGLGLALTRRLVELHGGTIWLESEFGRGSSFSFTISVTQNLSRQKSCSLAALTDSPLGGNDHWWEGNHDTQNTDR